jgi:hypothetical protein
MGQAYKRTDWNSIIQRVNALCQSPSAGCDAVALLDEVGENHRWSVQNIQAVRDKLTEICSENTFTAELVKWKQDIVDEIEAAIARGWCGCVSCANALGVVTTYIGAIEQTECTADTGNCTLECRTTATDLGLEADAAISDWALAYSELCDLQDELQILEAARDAACPGDGCAAAQEAVTAKQVEINAKQIEVNAFDALATSKATASILAAGECIPAGMVLSFTSLAGTAPWAISCNDPLKCRVGWRVETRDTTHYWFGGSFTGNWQTAITGGYTRQGSPLVTYMQGCVGVSAFACYSTDCEFGCDNTHTIEVKLVQVYPDPV